MGRIFNNTLDFPEDIADSVNRENMINGMSYIAELCHISLFIFEDVDKLEPGFIDALKPFIDITGKINGIDYRRSIFIFLSNTGGKEINKMTLEIEKSGQNRENILLKDVE